VARTHRPAARLARENLRKTLRAGRRARRATAAADTADTDERDERDERGDGDGDGGATATATATAAAGPAAAAAAASAAAACARARAVEVAHIDWTTFGPVHASALGRFVRSLARRARCRPAIAVPLVALAFPPCFVS